MARRRWIKLWAQELLYGSTTTELEPEERWVWVALLALAGDSVEQGFIMAAPGIAWTKDQLSLILKVPLHVLESAIQKMQAHSKINLNGNGIIQITNWERYQSDWDRIRKYPTQQPTKKPTPDEHTTKHTKKPTLITEEKGGEGRGRDNKKRIILKDTYGEFGNVMLTKEEYQKLSNKFGDSLKEKIEALSQGIASKGYKYKSHYATILSWERKNNPKKAEETEWNLRRG